MHSKVKGANEPMSHSDSFSRATVELTPVLGWSGSCGRPSPPRRPWSSAPWGSRWSGPPPPPRASGPRPETRFWHGRLRGDGDTHTHTHTHTHTDIHFRQNLWDIFWPHGHRGVQRQMLDVIPAHTAQNQRVIAPLASFVLSLYHWH